MGMKEVVGIVAFFVAVCGPFGIGFLVSTRHLAALLSAAWPIAIGVIMAIGYGLPRESFATWLIDVAFVMAVAAVSGIIAFNVKTKMKARRAKAI